MTEPSFDIARLHAAYATSDWTPMDTVRAVIERIGTDPHHAWIHVVPIDRLLAQAEDLYRRGPARLPLYGLPFAIKDNIDLAGAPTTAGCPDYAYSPSAHAFVVQRLVDAGALPIGKTNLDQFAAGLNGTRSPYGACLNAFDPAHVSGGSSSGSAVAVALGHVSFALGTDTAGSGRVPAAFNHLVGLKPTRGLLSTRGVVPACRSLDSVSILALSADDAHDVYASAIGFDAEDPYGRRPLPHGHDFGTAPTLRLGIPRAAQCTWDDADHPACFAGAIEHARTLNAELIEIDLCPFLEVAELLYGGPWLAERYAAIRDFVDRQPGSLFSVTRDIVLAGARPSAADAFDAQYRLRDLQRQTDAVWSQVDALLLPTTGGHPTIAQMLAEPVAANSALGTYTNFMNLLDCAGVAVPAGFRADGLPFGVTLVAPAHQDVPLLHLARRWQAALTGRAATLGATGARHAERAMRMPAVRSGWLRIAVCGAHLQGQPLNPQLTSRSARLSACTHTAPCYRLYALEPTATGVLRPGLVRTADGGAAIEVEVWELPAEAFGDFVAAIPPPLGIGTTVLADGSAVPGFVCEPIGLSGATDITAFGGWRAWLARPQ